MEIALEDVLRNLKPAIKENNAHITHDYLPNIMGDHVQIIQLLQNLIGNAIKFKGNNPPDIHISAQDKDNEWLFSVSDKGIGIDKIIKNRFLVFLKDYILEKSILEPV